MTGWNKNDDPWGKEPKRQKAYPADQNESLVSDSLFHEQLENKQNGEKHLDIPPSDEARMMICPWCGKEMRSGILSASQSVWWSPGEPSLKTSLQHGDTRSALQLIDEGSVFSLSRCRKTVWHCPACQKLVIDTAGLLRQDALF